MSDWGRRVFIAAASLAWPVGSLAAVDAEPSPRYEISINGENFTVESGKITQLKSADHPGTTYRVAVRLAPLQHWKLGGVQFDYRRGFEVTDNHQVKGRAATLKHPLGFVAVVTDLGGPLPGKARREALDLLVESIKKTLSSSGASDLEVSKPQPRKLGPNPVEAVTIGYRDADGTERMSAVYVVAGEKFACSCLLQCLEEDREDAVDLIKATLASLKPS